LLPKRIIKISKSIAASGTDTLAAMLVENTESERGPYCTLSYRWSSNPLTLQSSNISVLTHNIRLDNLPLTIQHAIIVASNLGLKYIWIDALCIIQDSVEDWREQSSVMHDIYNRSTLTIAAIDACEPTGIFTSMEQRKTTESRPKGVLDSRGWVLQEQALSRRLLSFTKYGTFWSCVHLECSESCPDGFDFDAKLNNSVAGVLPWLSDQPGSEQSVSTGYRLWNRILEDYSSRSLTKESDRSIAIRGVTSIFSRQLRDVNHAGVWEKDILRGLAWSRRGPINFHQASFEGPTWSCLTIGSSVDFQDLDDFGLDRFVDSVEIASYAELDGSISEKLVISARLIPVRLSGSKLYFSFLEGSEYDPQNNMQRYLKSLSRRGLKWICDRDWYGRDAPKMLLFGHYGMCLVEKDGIFRRIGICFLTHNVWKAIGSILYESGWKDTKATVTVV
jgi:hypothetical protein